MWTGPDAEPMRLPAARAERRIPPGGGYIEEELTLAAPSGEPFTRSARLNYNAVDGRFEYFSLDTRAPQQMSYRSQYADPNFAGLLKFEGGTFIAAQWGAMKNVALAYRVELSAVTEGWQTLRLFLKPLMAGKQREFMAFRYEYRRR